MVASQIDFANLVAADRNLVVTSADARFFRLERPESDLAWHCIAHRLGD